MKCLSIAFFFLAGTALCALCADAAAPPRPPLNIHLATLTGKETGIETLVNLTCSVAQSSKLICHQSAVSIEEVTVSDSLKSSTLARWSEIEKMIDHMTKMVRAKLTFFKDRISSQQELNKWKEFSNEFMQRRKQKPELNDEMSFWDPANCESIQAPQEYFQCADTSIMLLIDSVKNAGRLRVSGMLSGKLRFGVLASSIQTFVADGSSWKRSFPGHCDGSDIQVSLFKSKGDHGWTMRIFAPKTKRCPPEDTYLTQGTGVPSLSGPITQIVSLDKADGIIDEKVEELTRQMLGVQISEEHTRRFAELENFMNSWVEEFEKTRKKP